VSIGHLATLPYTREAIDVVVRNIEAVRRRVDVPLILENVTATVVIPGAEMDEPAFLTEVLERTGCGWLCDVTNLYTNAVIRTSIPTSTGGRGTGWSRCISSGDIGTAAS
jgi:uncharacterized protein